MRLKKLFPTWGKRKIVFTCVFLAATIFLALLIGSLNVKVTANVSERQYSVDNLVSHVYAVSRKEHSVYNEENAAEVRNYISSMLYGYGIKNEIIKHRTRYVFDDKTEQPVPYAPKNIYGEIGGESGTNVLLICHYDSCAYKIKYGEASEGSHGAIDDGYGVSVVLELARIYSTVGLKNGIKLAFVDGEEEGLVGSEALVEEYADWLSDINLVVNIEARGETGSVYLFQTSDNNEKLVDFYRNAGYPYTFSLAAEIYDMMPNDTDLSPFIEHGFAGLNLSTLDSLKTYHNEKDVFENIDKNTLAKYCDTLLPLLDEYTLKEQYSDMKYFDCASDALFFTLFPNALVAYNEIVGWVFFGIALALVVVLVVVLAVLKKINILKALISLAVDLGLLVVICGVGFVVALISCAICGVNYHLIFVIGVNADAALLIVSGIISVFAIAISTLIKRKLGISYSEMTVGALVIYAILSIVSAAVLFGGSFVFVIPTLLIGVGVFLTLIKNERWKMGLAATLVGVAVLFMLSLNVSLVYSVYVSLTFGALGFLLLLFALPFILLLPPAFGLYKDEQISVATEKITEVQA